MGYINNLVFGMAQCSGVWSCRLAQACGHSPSEIQHMHACVIPTHDTRQLMIQSWTPALVFLPKLCVSTLSLALFLFLFPFLFNFLYIFFTKCILYCILIRPNELKQSYI